MAYMYTTVIWILLLLLGPYATRKIAAHIAYLEKVEKNGCQRPPQYPYKDPMSGTDLNRAIKKHMLQGDASKIVRQRFQKYGKTFEAKSVGGTVLYTMDPKNIQTILALEFDKFGVGPRRKVSVGRWMDQGIS